MIFRSARRLLLSGLTEKCFACTIKTGPYPAKKVGLPVTLAISTTFSILEYQEIFLLLLPPLILDSHHPEIRNAVTKNKRKIPAKSAN